MKLTEKQKFIYGLLKNHKEGINCIDFIKTYKDLLEKEKIDTEKLNSVNATLSSLVPKGLVRKVKDNNKKYTDYFPIDIDIEEN